MNGGIFANGPWRHSVQCSDLIAFEGEADFARPSLIGRL